MNYVESSERLILARNLSPLYTLNDQKCGNVGATKGPDLELEESAFPKKWEEMIEHSDIFMSSTICL